MTTDELDQLLMDRFNLVRADLIAALKTLAPRSGRGRPRSRGRRQISSIMPALRRTREAYREIAADVIAHMGLLYSTAYTAAEVAKGLVVNDSRVRQRRLAHTLRAIDDGGTWVYPSLQFELVDNGRGQTALKQVRGLDQVLPHLLAQTLHPTAVAGFLLTPQPDLRINGQPHSVRDWLLHGESVQPGLDLIDVGQWAVT